MPVESGGKKRTNEKKSEGRVMKSPHFIPREYQVHETMHNMETKQRPSLTTGQRKLDENNWWGAGVK